MLERAKRIHKDKKAAMEAAFFCKIILYLMSREIESQLYSWSRSGHINSVRLIPDYNFFDKKFLVCFDPKHVKPGSQFVNIKDYLRCICRCFKDNLSLVVV